MSDDLNRTDRTKVTLKPVGKQTHADGTVLVSFRVVDGEFPSGPWPELFVAHPSPHGCLILREPDTPPTTYPRPLLMHSGHYEVVEDWHSTTPDE